VKRFSPELKKQVIAEAKELGNVCCGSQASKQVTVPKKRGRPVPGYTVNPNGTIVTDASIVKALRDYREGLNFSNAGGYHKIKHYLRRDYDYHVNHKKLYRLCKQEGLLLLHQKKKPKKNRTGPNQLWQFDLKYGYLHGENRFFFVTAFIDVFSRKVIDYHVGLSCKAGN